jgi:beta-lactamase superfamily II metal-dependent hydrolase
MAEIRYVNVLDGYLAKKAGNSPSTSSNKPLLIGARVHVDLSNAANGWAPANSVPNAKGQTKSGFVNLAHVSSEQQLKVFYTDVGQGDATLIEAEGGIVIIDGGPNRAFYNVLKDRLAALRRADQDIGVPPRPSLRINAVVVSHFDKDHFVGLKGVFDDPEFEVGTLYHNGLPRYGNTSGKDLTLGDVTDHQDGSRSISTDLTGSSSANKLVPGPLFLTPTGKQNQFSKFMQSVLAAETAGRLGTIRRLYRRDTGGTPDLLSNVGPDLQIEVLGPVTTRPTGAVRLPVFPNPHSISPTNPQPAGSESHTVNGNSVVLRLKYKKVSFLFGGDLNRPAQKYLSDAYGATNPFSAEVNKACHHGSSDFDLQFVKNVKPHATVFSSGDNGSYDHPLPDAMGTAARHSRGSFPLIFSTELARDNKVKGKPMLGHINARSNGDDIVMAQKKEKASATNPWHTFPLPYPGPFGGH